MIRILQIVNIMDRAGIENMLMNYYRQIDRTKIQFDFLTHRPNEGAYDHEINLLGGKVYHAPRLYPQNFKSYFKYMADFFEKHKEYTIVHSHIDAMSYLPLLAAKKAGVKIRIAHSHSTSIDRDFKWPLKQYFRKRLPSVATEFAACSKLAGKYLFNDNSVKIIYNAIDIGKFVYDERVRKKKREEFGLNGKFVIGHVGRFTEAKNHKFIIEIFERVLLKKNSSVLLLVGNGELMDETNKYISEKNLSNNVIILSDRDDVQEIYQAMDVFVFPSKYEGLGMGAVEAEITGLVTYVSNKVPKEVKISDNLEFLKLNKEIWIDKLLGLESYDRHTCYNKNYDIKEATMLLENYYIQLEEKMKTQ